MTISEISTRHEGGAYLPAGQSLIARLVNSALALVALTWCGIVGYTVAHASYQFNATQFLVHLASFHTVLVALSMVALLLMFISSCCNR